MVFSSAVFLFVFLPVVLLLYFVPLCFWNRRLEDHRKNLVLCAASLIFYAWGEPVYIILMLLSIGFNFNIGLDMERSGDDPKAKKRILIAAVVFDLTLLGFFKYSNFLIGNFNGLLMLGHRSQYSYCYGDFDNSFIKIYNFTIIF